MDDIEAEFNTAPTNASFSESESTRGERIKTPVPLHAQAEDRGRLTAVDFLKSNRKCLKLMRDAMLQHQWREAAGFFCSYIQTLEASTYNTVESAAAEITWRLGTEILHHLPNSSVDDFHALYEQLKNYGVRNFSKISLEHCFHLLLNGQTDEAKRQLSIAESWRYGKISSAQSLTKTLISAYCGFLDYLIWCEKKSSASDNEESGSNREMHSYFRQASVTLKQIISQPGIWDPFVLSYIDMLEFYNDEDGALQVLENYAYNKDFPSNPNAHVYLYEFLKRHDATQTKLISTLKILHSLVPSHELMLELCSLLLESDETGDLDEALTVSVDLLEFSSWKCDLRAWENLLEIMEKFKKQKHLEALRKEWTSRRSLFLALHFRNYIGRKDLQENPSLLRVKRDVLRLTGEKTREYNRITFSAEKEGIIKSRDTGRRTRKRKARHEEIEDEED